MAYIRKFKTSSGATGVQVCWKVGRRVVRIEHIGSARSEEGLERLVERGREVIRGEGQGSLFDMRGVKKS